MIALWTLIKRETLRFFVVANNTILPAMVSAALYLVIFGVALGGRISGGSGDEYMAFLIPGLMLMQLVMGSYSNTSGSLWFSRMLGFVNDVLLSSMSYTKMVLAYVIGGSVRGITLAAGVWLISIPFVLIGVQRPFLLILHALLITITFASLGIIIGLWAERHDQLNILMNFALTPLVFLGGVFYSINQIPAALQTFTRFNPIFYMVNGVRYSMTGVQEAPIWLGLLIISSLCIIFVTVSTLLFRSGWKLRT